MSLLMNKQQYLLVLNKTHQKVKIYESKTLHLKRTTWKSVNPLDVAEIQSATFL